MSKKITPSRLNRNPDYVLNDYEKELIRIMFFGPYEDEWRTEKGIIDNSDTAIAKRLGLKEVTVSNYTTKICEDHFDFVIKFRELTIKNTNYD